MEQHLNARVLPSNAPALPDDTSGLLSPPTDLTEILPSQICQSFNCGSDCFGCNLLHVCFRCRQHGHPATDCKCSILRASSGNVGLGTFQSCNTDLKPKNTQKYAFRPVSSFINPPRHSAQAAIKAEYPRRQQHPSYSSLKGFPYWNVEWQTPRYRTYREKIRQKGSKDEKWPDRVEEAFQIAIRKIGKRGRRKNVLHGKQSGGNEFIADFIKKTTGVQRSRKQVSSHIQVLKGFLFENKACGSDSPVSQSNDADCSTSGMSLVADIKPEKSNKKAHGSPAHEETADGASENFEDDDASEYQSSQALYPPFPNHNASPIEMLASNEYPGPTIRRVLAFTMTLVDKNDDNILLHTYTSIQSETASALRALEDVNKWREKYPPLAADFDRGRIGCPIFLFDTHLSLMDHYCQSNLAIRFSMEFGQGAHFTDWRSYPRFYEQNGCPVDLTKIYPESGPCDLLHSSPITGTENARLVEIAFKSKWWARVFSSVMGEKMAVEKNGDPRLIREEEERTIQVVHGISVMQEIWATHRVHNHRRQRMAIIVWKFSTAKRGVTATTSWRRLSLPLSPYNIQSPHPPSENPPMTLDAALQATSAYVGPYTAQPSIFSRAPTGDSVTTALSADSSPLATPTPESRSFPSSTSTSFPSLVSNSIYPLYPSQESSFHSQDSVYPTLSSFHFQESGHPSYDHHETVEAAHESYGSHEFADGSQESYGSQEIIYHSQDSLYQHAPDQLYDYPYQIVDAPVTASTSQDFTGGQIHLSYAQTEDSQSSYEAPLIAPQAHMIPQHHQLIQHLEHFDQHDFLEHNPDDLSGGHDEVDEQAHAQPLPQPDELNGLSIDYNEWEETLRLNPDLERHLGINSVEEVAHLEQDYMMHPLDQGALESRPGTVLGEVQDEDGSPGGEMEY